MILKLNESNLREATHLLAERDETMAKVFLQYGYPPLWSREPGFATLVHMILEQQVSLASANAAFNRLSQHLSGQITPEHLLQMSDESMRTIGFSRQKINYARALAEALIHKHLDLSQLDELSDAEVKTTLVALKGIGVWTADIYLSECLLRTDILPKGDIAMLEAFRVLNQLNERPDHPYFESATEHWRPWRSVGSRMLWHFYLCERKK
ncbi:MAG: DNA-3-methyladenine glycosylase 2 family protein [Bacteroidota bacterium]